MLREIERKCSLMFHSFPIRGLNRYKRVDTQGCKTLGHSHLVTNSHLFVSTTLTLTFTLIIV